MTARRFSGSDEVFEWLLGFINVEKGQKTEFKLDRMRSLCEALGSPELAYATVHVAGSKGKGSVSAMTARILEAAGLKTGLYTSPHLLRWKERMSLAGEELDESVILSAVERLQPLVEGRSAADFMGAELPTYFELTTIVAFLAFELASCDAAVIETGLGGRLDSTNVVAPACTIITPIELEHTEWLGDTLGQIAYEKAGIIKPGVPCVISSQRPEAMAVFRESCATRGAELVDVRERARIEDVGLDRRGTRARIAILDAPGGLGEGLLCRVPLVGAVQAENMALAILAARVVLPTLGEDAIRAGLSRSSLPARFEILDLEPPVVLDGAHTPASIDLCLASFKSLFPGPADLVFACAIDKKHEEMAAILSGQFANVTVTRPGTFKDSRPDLVAQSFGLDRGGCRLVEDTTTALREARETAKASGRPLLVAGSFYLCAEAAILFRPATSPTSP